MMARVLALVLSLGLSAPAFAETKPFVRGSWQEIATKLHGRPGIVHLWGLTCAPCLAELPQWGKLARTEPALPIILIAADPIPEDPERIATQLRQSGLENVESWGFADAFTDRLRFEIDAKWRGELPRTLLIDGDGGITALSGRADFDEINRWLRLRSR